MKPQAMPGYYDKFRERIDSNGLPGALPGRWQQFLNFLTGKRPLQ
jgi:hypothetical protein